jgi:hypothetical protein
MFYPLMGMLLLCAIWCAYWYIAFLGAKELVQARRPEFAGKGLQLDCARESWGGFPFRFEFQCEAASLQFTQGNESISLRSMKLLAVAQAYNPLHVLLLIDGPSSVNGVKLTHGRSLVSIAASRNGDWDMSSEAAGVNASGLFSTDQLKLFARKTNGRLDLVAYAETLIVLMPDHSVTSISHAELIAQTSTAVLDPPFHGPTVERPLEIKSLKISQGPVDFAAQGRIFLDPQHRLAGRLSSQTNDIDGLMPIIAPIFSLNEQDSASIKNLLNLTGRDSATNTTKADFTANEGALYWGALKLADLISLY